MIIDKLLKIAKSEQLSVFGTGLASMMKDEKAGYRPDDFIPGAKSTICFGIPIPEGIYSTKQYNAELVWRSQNLLYRRLDSIALKISVLIEETGTSAIPIYGCAPLGVNRKGTVVGILNQLRMAETIGLGVIGKNGLLLNSNYGARLMLGSVVTSASLPIMRYPEIKESGCPPDCQLCLEACPMNAIIPENKKVKIMKCLQYTAKTPSMSMIRFLCLRSWNKNNAARYLSMTSYDEHTFHVCSKCVSVCPYGK
jgi:epoxyqueuosine reductase QueG